MALEKKEKILLIALSGIGNFIMQSPTIETLKKHKPNSHITVWVAPRGTKILAQNNPYVDEVIEMPIKTTIFKHLSQIEKIKQHQFTMAIVLSPGQQIKSAMYMYLAGIPARIGSTYPLLGNNNSHALLTNSIQERADIHDIEQNLGLLSSLQIPVKEGMPYTTIIPESAYEEAKNIWRSLHIEPGATVIGLHAGSAPDFLWKRWPLENFAQIATHYISKKNAHVLLFGGPDETSQKEELQQLISSPRHIHSIDTDLLTTGALMQQCAYVIANDSGLMHLCASVSTPTFGIFGPTNEALTGPRGTSSYVIRAQGTKPVYNTETNYSLGNSPHQSLLALTPEEVITHIKKVLP